MGSPEFVKADMVKPGAVVIDVGVNRVAGRSRAKGGSRLVGDVDFAGVSRWPERSRPIPAAWAR